MKYTESDVPFHSKLKDELEKDILNGKYKPGEMIPSENELALSKGISRPTVRQAFSELVSKGLLKKVKGKGTFVADFKSIDTFDHTKGFIHTILDCNDNSKRLIKAVHQVDGNEIVRNRKLSDVFGGDFAKGFGSRFIKVEYSFEDENVYCESYLPLMYFPEATSQIERNARSHEILAGKIPLEPRSARCSLMIFSADTKAAETLGLSVGSEIISIESILLNGRGSIVEFCVVSYKSRNTEVLFNKIRNI